MPRPCQYAYSLLAPLILSLIRTSIASDASTLEMDAPQPIAECAEDTFTWQGGLPPYTLSLRDADSGALVFSNDGLTDNVLHWVATVAAGTNLILELMDTGVNGASGARISESFTVEPGDDPCLSNSNSPTSSSSPSASTPQQSSDGTIIPSSFSPSPSGEQPTTSSPSTSPPPDSTTLTTTTNPSSSPSSSTGTGAPAGSTGSPSSSQTGPDGSSIATPSPGAASGSPDPSSSGRSPGGSTSGAIAGAAVGSLAAGFALAAALFCVWRARRAKRGRGAVQVFGARERVGGHSLEPYGYPAGDPARTVRHAPPVPEHDRARDLERRAHQLGVTSDLEVRERPGPGLGKGRWLDSSESMSPSMQRTATQSAIEGGSLPVNGAGRGWEYRHGEVDESDALDLADYSAYSTSSAPPPYSQIE